MSKKNKKGLNMERVQEVLENAIENVEEIEMVEEKLTKEDIETLKEEINEKVIEVVEEKREELENTVKEIENMNKIIINREIRKAINAGKDLATKGMNGKQFKAITGGYQEITGEELSENQLNYIKTLNEAQARFIIVTINQYKRHLRTLEMMAVANAES